jgi:hypothetical protein
MDREPLSRGQGRSPRWVSVVLLLTVFFLPLHFHASTAISSQLTKECTCLHGTRAQAHLSDTTVACISGVVRFTIVPIPEDQFDSQSVGRPSSRAPPRPASL